MTNMFIVYTAAKDTFTSRSRRNETSTMRASSCRRSTPSTASSRGRLFTTAVLHDDDAAVHAARTQSRMLKFTVLQPSYATDCRTQSWFTRGGALVFKADHRHPLLPLRILQRPRSWCPASSGMRDIALRSHITICFFTVRVHIHAKTHTIHIAHHIHFCAFAHLRRLLHRIPYLLLLLSPRGPRWCVSCLHALLLQQHRVAGMMNRDVNARCGTTPVR